uniref:F-box domain-containing protein n=1 Tax=Leersia perrieri TaxID=77586 RepID=A0A0D9XHP0_9ORYZ
MGGVISSCFGPHRRPPFLTDDILIEIFIRLAPHPVCLWRVSLVNRRLVTSRLHGCAPAAPLVGFFQNRHHGENNRFVPIGIDGAIVHRNIRFRRRHGRCPAAVGRRGVFAPGEQDWNVLGCRRGRVLLLSPERLRLLVLDPLMGRRQYINTPVWPDFRPVFFSNGAVVSAPGGHDELRPHLFRVVFVASDAANRRTTTFIYNSVTFRWTKVATDQRP